MTIEQELPMSGDVAVKRLLSANQEFFCGFDRGNDLGAFGPRHLECAGWRLHGDLDIEVLRLALNDVVVRHEALRTAIVRDDGAPYALVHPAGPVELAISDLPADGDETDRDRRAHEFLNEVESGRCDIADMPLLRAKLGRFEDKDAVLVLVTHHTVSDGWSMHLIMRDVAVFYATRRGLPTEGLPSMRQQGDHASRQQQVLAGEPANLAREYWKGKLAGGKFVTLPPDRVRELEVPPVYSVYRFLVDKHLTAATTAFAKSMRCSPFMVLYACFNLFLHHRTGVSDIVAPTLTSGRGEPEFHETVGPFFNFAPVRTDLSGCENFRDVVRRTRATLLEAYSHELPFREVAAQAEPELMHPFVDPNGVVTAFEVLHSPEAPLEGQLVGDVRYAHLRRRLISHPNTSEIPDGNLWALDLDPAGDMLGTLKYNSLHFDEQSIVAMVEEYDALLRASLAFPDAPLNR